jgi:hypothetical protein
MSMLFEEIHDSKVCGQLGSRKLKVFLRAFERAAIKRDASMRLDSTARIFVTYY